MSLNLDLYRDRLDAYKVSGNDGIIDSMKKQILDNFYINPSYEDVEISSEPRGVHIVQEGVRGLRILCKPNEDIASGEYVKWKEKNYLCTHRFPDDKIHTKGTIQFCNHDLRWIDKDTGELVIKSCIEDARTLYTTGIKEEEVMEIPNGMVGIQLPFGDVTRRLDRGDRFIFNKASYRITFYDETNYKGLVTLICAETGLTHKDDKINEIADRWVEINGEMIDRLPWLDEQEPIEPIEPEEPTSGVVYKIKAKKKYETDTEFELSSKAEQTYTVTKFVDGEEVDATFAFSLSESLDGVRLAQRAENSCTLYTDIIYGKQYIFLLVLDIETEEIALEQVIYIKGV